MNISKHWTGFLIKLFIGCNMLNQQCLNIKFAGSRTYPLTEEVVKSVVQPLPSSSPAMTSSIFISSSVMTSSIFVPSSAAMTSSIFVSSSSNVTSSMLSSSLMQTKTARSVQSTLQSTKLGPSSISPSTSRFISSRITQTKSTPSQSHPNTSSPHTTPLKPSQTQSYIFSSLITTTSSPAVNSTAVRQPNADKRTSSNSNNDTKIIIGIVVAIIIIIIIIIIILALIRKRKRDKENLEKNGKSKKFASNFNQASIRSLNSLRNASQETPTISSSPNALNSYRNKNPLFQNSPSLSPRSDVTIASDERDAGFSNAAYDGLPEDYYHSGDEADANSVRRSPDDETANSMSENSNKPTLLDYATVYEGGR